MIYLFCGDHHDKVQAKYHSVLNSLKAKRPEGIVYDFEYDTFDFGTVRALLEQQSLFEAKYLLTWHNLLTNQKVSASFQADLIELLPVARTSNHIILWKEGVLTAKQKKDLTGFCEKVEEFNLKVATKENDYAKAFLLNDYLGERKKQEAWTYFNQLLQEGMLADELTGPLLYFMKTLALVSNLAADETAGLKPFVIGKYKKFARNFSKEVIAKKYEQLLDAIAESRTISIPLAHKLESWILSW